MLAVPSLSEEGCHPPRNSYGRLQELGKDIEGWNAVWVVKTKKII